MHSGHGIYGYFWTNLKLENRHTVTDFFSNLHNFAFYVGIFLAIFLELLYFSRILFLLYMLVIVFAIFAGLFVFFLKFSFLLCFLHLPSVSENQLIYRGAPVDPPLFETKSNLYLSTIVTQ